jgi:hypothetical protein
MRPTPLFYRSYAVGGTHAIDEYEPRIHEWLRDAVFVYS